MTLCSEIGFASTSVATMSRKTLAASNGVDKGVIFSDSNGDIQYTLDAGSTWAIVNSGLSAFNTFTKNTGFYTGQRYGSLTDTNSIWSVSDLPLTDPLNIDPRASAGVPAASIRGIASNGNGTLIAVSSLDAAYDDGIVYSNDHGITWAEASYPSVPTTDDRFIGGASWDGSRFIVITRKGRILESTDLGATFVDLFTIPSALLPDRTNIISSVASKTDGTTAIVEVPFSITIETILYKLVGSNLTTLSPPEPYLDVASSTDLFLFRLQSGYGVSADLENFCASFGGFTQPNTQPLQFNDEIFVPYDNTKLYVVTLPPPPAPPALVLVPGSDFWSIEPSAISGVSFFKAAPPPPSGDPTFLRLYDTGIGLQHFINGPNGDAYAFAGNNNLYKLTRGQPPTLIQANATQTVTLVRGGIKGFLGETQFQDFKYSSDGITWNFYDANGSVGLDGGNNILQSIAVNGDTGDFYTLHMDYSIGFGFITAVYRSTDGGASFSLVGSFTGGNSLGVGQDQSLNDFEWISGNTFVISNTYVWLVDLTSTIGSITPLGDGLAGAVSQFIIPTGDPAALAFAGGSGNEVITIKTPTTDFLPLGAYLPGINYNSDPPAYTSASKSLVVYNGFSIYGYYGYDADSNLITGFYTASSPTGPYSEPAYAAEVADVAVMTTLVADNDTIYVYCGVFGATGTVLLELTKPTP